MPTLKYKLPSYRLHRASGQAVVTLNGRDIYLGVHGNDESRENYRRIIEEWLASHRRPQSRGGNGTAREIVRDATIAELFAAYWEFVQQYYRKNGQPTNEVDLIGRALRPMLQLYGRQPVRSFGPLALKTCRERLIGDGLTRGAINKHIGRCKRFLKWATENELIPPEIYHAVSTVGGLRRGRSLAPESEPVRAVRDEAVDAVLPRLNRYVAAMVRIQRLTGMRPGEIVITRTRDVDRIGQMWLYRPHSHKTEHHDRERVIYFGPQAQAMLEPFLLPDQDAYIFSPKMVLAEHRAELRRLRKTPLTPSQRRRRQKRHPRKQPGDRYTTRSYYHAIRDACRKLFPVPEGFDEKQAARWRREHWWSPNQLRHAAATRLRRDFGLDAARVVLGHRSPAVTEVYAELDQGRAAAVMAEIG